MQAPAKRAASRRGDEEASDPTHRRLSVPYRTGGRQSHSARLSRGTRGAGPVAHGQKPRDEGGPSPTVKGERRPPALGFPHVRLGVQRGGVGGTREQASSALTVQGPLRVTRLVLAMTLAMPLIVAAGARAAVPGWLGQEQVDPHNSALNTVSCSAPSYCVTGGLDLVVQDHAVQLDLSTQLSPNTDEIAAISCARNSTFCAVTDDSGGAYTLSGETLSARTQVAADGFDAVSCPTSSFCMAIDGTGDTFKYSGGSWSSTGTRGSLPSDTSDLQVSCASAGFCLAALPGSGSDESYYTYNGANWTGPSVLESTGAVESGLSCTSSSFCVAADTSDNTEKFNGSSWTAPLHHGTGTSLSDQFSVSCAGTFCLADSFEDGSTYLTSGGTSWSSGSNLEDTGTGGGGPTSCTSSTMCVVVDLSGAGNTYALPDTLATQPSLAGSAVAGATINLTSGTAASPDASVVDLFQRCLGDCTPLLETSYTTTTADDGASIQDSETTGVGLDIEGPFASNTIGPISSPSTGTGGSDTGGSGSGGTSPPPLATGASLHPLAASIGTAKVSGASAQVTVSCPTGSSTSCPVKVILVVTEKLLGRKVIGISTRKRTTTRKVTLGTASATLQPGTHRQLTVSLNGAGKRLLAARRTLKVDLSMTQNDASPVTQHVAFQAARRKHR
jgi:hypothetical protein